MARTKSKLKTVTRSRPVKTAKRKSSKRPVHVDAVSGTLTKARTGIKNAQVLCHAAGPRGNDDRSHHGGNRLAATFRARLPCRGRPEETGSKLNLRTRRRRSRLSYRRHASGPTEASGVMQCGTNIVPLLPRPDHPGHLSKTRSRICAISMLGGCVPGGRAFSSDRRLFTCHGIYCLRSWPSASRPIVLATSTTRPGRFWIAPVPTTQVRLWRTGSRAWTRSGPT